MKFTKRLFCNWHWFMVLLAVLALAGPAFAGSTWIQLNPTPDPTLGSSPSVAINTAVYNPTTNRMILFGGRTDQMGYGMVNDVWVLTNADGTGGTSAWTKLTPLAPNGAPSPREMSAAVYDQANNRMIVHGGYAGGSCFSDTWVLTNADGTEGQSTWLKLNTTGPAPVRRAHTAVFDAANNRLIVHGGMPSVTGLLYDETWVLTNANGLGGTPVWTKLAPASAIPLGNWFANGPAGYDPATSSLIAFDSYNLGNGYLSKVRLLQNANGLGGSPLWTELTPTGEAPLYLVSPAGVYEAGRNRMVIFGGSGEIYFNDVWRLDYANGQRGAPLWTKVNIAGPLPAPRAFDGVTSRAGYNAQSDRLIIYGGRGETYHYDVWILT